MTCSFFFVVVVVVQKGEITMTLVFVAPDDSDDEDLSNCEQNNHLNYKFFMC